MSPSPVSGRSTPRPWYGMSLPLLALLAVLLCGAQAKPVSGPPLREGLSLKREIRGGEPHVYPVPLKAGQFLRVVVEEESTDLAVKLFDPKGAFVTGVDSPTFRGLRSSEDLAVVAAASGLYRLEVSEVSGGAGRYRLAVQDIHDASEEDKLRAEAVRKVWDGLHPPDGDRLERVVSIWDRLQDRRHEAEILFALGQLRSLRSDEYETGVRNFLRSAALWKGQPGPRARSWRGEALNSAGVLLVRLGRPDEARGCYEEARAITGSLGDARIQAISLSNLAMLEADRGDPRKAIELFQAALQKSRDAGNPEPQIQALIGLGTVYDQLGERQNAIESLLQVLKLAKGTSEDKATALNNLGATYYSLGDWESALKYYGQALALNQKDSYKAKTLINIGAALQHLKQFPKAQKSYHDALQLGQAAKDPEIQAYARINQAFLSLKLKQPAKAIEPARQALQLAQGFSDREADALYALGSAHRELGDLKTARKELAKALSIAQDREDRSKEAEFKLALARVERDGGNLAAARRLVDSSVGLVESLRTQVSDQGLRASFLATKQDFYEFYIDTLMALHASRKPEGLAAKALQVSERARARSLLDILNESGADIRKGANPASLSVAEIQDQILDRRAVLLEYALGAKRSFLWAVSPGSVESFELADRGRLEKAALQWYGLLTDHRQQSAGETAQEWEARIAQADAKAERAARDLSRMILQPAERTFGHDRPLLIVADGALQYIPFAALPTSSGAPLVTDHVVVNLPSASILAALRRDLRNRPRAPKMLAVFANPVFEPKDDRLNRVKLASATRGDLEPTDARGSDEECTSFRRLRSSEEEAKKISRLASPEPVLLASDFKASRARAMSPEIALYRNVHFATHGVLDISRPELSKLVLSCYDERGRKQDGFLRLRDIYRLHLKADLVVLSACKTALGKEVRGEGLIGLTRGFMYSGAARVLASLWSVEDLATARLMEKFYRGMLRERLSPAEALRRAQLEMARSPSWKSPYHWAGFSLQGEWGR